MKIRRFGRHLHIGLLAVLLFFTQFAAARPLQIPFSDDNAATHKLPPVNYIRSRDVDIENVAIDLRFDWEKEQAFGNTVVTLSPFTDLDSFTLDAAQMQINSVTLANGKNLQFKYTGGDTDNNLKIILDRMYKRGEELAVKIDYRTSYVNKADGDSAIGSFGRGIRFIKPTEDEPNKPYQIWSQGETEFNRYWFPSYDAPNDFRTTELRATVKKPYSVISNGRLVNVKENNDNTRTFDWKMDTPYSNYLTSIVVGEYTEIKDGEYDGIPVYAYGYPAEKEAVAETTKRVPQMIKFFSEKTGVKYAYPKYSQTMVEDFGGGMENISATTQIEEMIHDKRELLDGDSDSLQSHELAHQWFGDFVTCRTWGQIWLNESFATYFQALWDEESKGDDYFLYEDVKKNQDQVLATWNQGNRRPIVTKYYANKDAMFDSYAYPGGGSVLHMLRKELGDELFFKSLNRYLTDNAHQPVETEQLRIAIEKTTGQSMDWFFDQWLYKMGHPVFEVTKRFDPGKKQLILTVRQTQKTDPKNEFPQTEFFRASVDIEIDGKVQRVWIKPQAENVFTFSSATEPKLVNFDYQGTLLKEVKFDKSDDELIYQMANDSDVLGRVRAMEELGTRLKKAKEANSTQIRAALEQAAAKDKVWQLRRDAVQALIAANSDRRTNTASFDEKTIDTLKIAAKDTNSRVRAAAISGLGMLKDDKYANVFLSALNDPSYTVINSAAVALGQTKDEKAYDALINLTNMDSWKDRIRVAGLQGLAALGDKRALDIGFKFAGKSYPGNVRSSSLSVVAATGKGDARVFPLLFEPFKKDLDQRNFQSIFTGLSSMILLGDPRGQQAFDLAKAKFKDNQQLMGYVTRLESQFKAELTKNKQK
ncbi:MAG: M1 family metallopeptidase [Acidobacteria bacterium]|nr:M1 family metallopeptidase [Acidobacteriota bacterium]